MSNKEDVIAIDKDGCALVEEDLPSDYEEADLTGDCNSVSEENQHRLFVSVNLDLDQCAPEELASQAICCSNNLANLANQR